MTGGLKSSGGCFAVALLVFLEFNCESFDSKSFQCEAVLLSSLTF